ncbi:MAG: hypothetical protein KKF46_04350 [Nanoarchaeota archaeon]|nr:hypothetical protein [Nanoarchaeota archaeon]MBU1321567.1 hypothetical protein [Nanoarchaeota archaeon]MBU1596847.1 hypothetical protein [Nanoarchaeota archaeon]MBU2442117.1 hypothetical protein [Nanoarchaeota archaeon]
MDEAEFEELMRIQRMTLRTVTNESETDDKIKLMNIINDLVTDKNKKIQKESILLEAQVEGMAETEIERILGLLKSDRFIREIEDGFIIRI